MNKQKQLNYILYECKSTMTNKEKYSVQNVIYFTYNKKDDQINDFDYQVQYLFNNKDNYDSFNPTMPKEANFLDKVDRDDDSLIVTYYRNIDYKYNNNGIDNYIKNIESNNTFKCEVLNEKSS